MSAVSRRSRFLARGGALTAIAAATGTLLAQAPEAAPVPVQPVQATVENEPLLTDEVLPATTTRFFLARDPFEPVRPAVADVDDVTDPADPEVDPEVEPVDDPCDGTVEVVCDGQVVTLVDVDDTSAVVRVDGTLHTVTAGATFATSYRVVTIDGACVTLLYGDDAFTLCEGEQVLK